MSRTYKSLLDKKAEDLFKAYSNGSNFHELWPSEQEKFYRMAEQQIKEIYDPIS